MSRNKMKMECGARSLALSVILSAKQGSYEYHFYDITLLYNVARYQSYTYPVLPHTTKMLYNLIFCGGLSRNALVSQIVSKKGQSKVCVFKRVSASSFLYNQRTNSPVNAHLISWPSKAQNIHNPENIW